MIEGRVKTTWEYWWERSRKIPTHLQVLPLGSLTCTNYVFIQLSKHVPCRLGIIKVIFFKKTLFLLNIKVMWGSHTVKTWNREIITLYTARKWKAFALNCSLWLQIQHQAQCGLSIYADPSLKLLYKISQHFQVGFYHLEKSKMFQGLFWFYF